MDPKELVTVYSVTTPMEAEIIKNYLQSEGIQCFLEGIHQAAFKNWIGDDIKVQVPAGDADRARKMIEHHEVRHTGNE